MPGELTTTSKHTLREQIELLREEVMELRIRVRQIPIKIALPEGMTGDLRSAYLSGYEEGFRGWDKTSPYTSLRHFKAFRAGRMRGNQDVADILNGRQPGGQPK